MHRTACHSQLTTPLPAWHRKTEPRSVANPLGGSVSGGAGNANTAENPQEQWNGNGPQRPQRNRKGR